MTLYKALMLILHVATEWITDCALSSLVHLYVAVAKQENATTKFPGLVLLSLHYFGIASETAWHQ